MSLDSEKRGDAITHRPRAVLVAVQLPGVTDDEQHASFEELGRLVTTLGLDPVAKITQRRKGLARGSVLGEGKLRELAAWTGGKGHVPSPVKRKTRRIDAGEPEEDEADAPPVLEVPEAERASVVVVDHELSPSQARNLEKATGVEVIDRSSVILRIFQRHARTREARLQVEIARLSYDAPRLRESSGGGDRQRGGIGGKGAGETSLELDRRRIRDRIAELRRELEGIAKEEGVRRSRRRERGDTVALVGYTNAGKSSWFRRLTRGEVYVADELFATLDTTVRALAPPVMPRVLVSDTVGFIKKLPHDLVASFRSTLDEARDASLLVHVIDAADAAWREQLAVTREVLGELGLTMRPLGAESTDDGPDSTDDGPDSRPCLLIFNKVDRIDPATQAELALEHPDALFVSAYAEGDVERVHARVRQFFEASMIDAELVVPWSHHRVVHEVHESARVLSEEHGESGTTLRIRAPGPVVTRLRQQLG